MLLYVSINDDFKKMLINDRIYIIILCLFNTFQNIHWMETFNLGVACSNGYVIVVFKMEQIVGIPVS